MTALRLSTLTQQLAQYGNDNIDEERAVEKFLRVVPKKYVDGLLRADDRGDRSPQGRRPPRAATSL
jgi:hypothetical protein